MKKLALLVAASFLFPWLISAPMSAVNATEIAVSGKSAVLIEAGTGKIIYAKNENEKLPIASTTKILTTLLCLESGELDEPFVVDPNAIKVEGSSMGLQEGNIVTKTALCYGMLLPSGNDAANVVALKLGETVAGFAEKMNARAKQIGMKNSHFVTPSGLHDKAHYSTAYDMALLTKEALLNPEFAAICRQQNAKLSYGSPPYDRWLKNSNKLLGMYAGCIGVKTGFTDEAGRCLVSAAERDGVTLICVTLKAPNDWDDHKKLLDYGFSVVKSMALPLPEKALSIDLVGGYTDRVSLTTDRTPMLSIAAGDEGRITSKVFLPRFLYAPVKSGSAAGRIEYFFDGERVLEIPIIANGNADAYIVAPKLTLFEKIKELLYGAKEK